MAIYTVVDTPRGCRGDTFSSGLEPGVSPCCQESGAWRVTTTCLLPSSCWSGDAAARREGEFDACVGIAIGKNDEVYTAEFRNQRVQRFTSEGQFLGAFPVQPHAGGVAVDPEGNVYVAHWNSNKVAAYSPTGELLREWGGKGTGDGEFQLPGSVALGPDGLLYVPDQGNSRVQKFTREGKFVGKWGELGKEPGQFGGGQPAGGRFAGPQFVAFDRAGNVYTTDAALDRIQKFTPEGKLLAFWGSGECRARRVRASAAEQGRYAGHGRPDRAVRGPAGPGLGERHQQPRPAVHERRQVPARRGRRGHRSRPLPPATRDRAWTATTACTSRIR